MILKRKIIKKTGTILISAFGSIIADVVLLFLLLLIPAVQTFVAKQMAQYLSNELHAKVTIEQISISPSLDVNLKNVFISDQHYNPMIVGEEITIALSSIAPFEQKMEIKAITLSQGQVHLKKYASEKLLNIKFFTDFFSSTDTLSKKPKWKIVSRGFSLKNSNFTFHNYHKLPLDAPNKIDINHLELSGVNGEFSKLHLNGDTLRTTINKFSVGDKSGFGIKRLSGEATIFPGCIEMNRMALKTANSTLFANVRLTYQNSSDFKDFQDKVYIDVRFYKSSVNTKDVSYFIKNTPAFENKINFSAIISGVFNDLNVKQFTANFGRHTSLSLQTRIQGLAHPRELVINGKLNNLTTSADDLQQCHLPMSKTIAIPPQLSQLGTIKANGKFDGTFDNFDTKLDVKTAAGNAESTIKYITKGKQVTYVAMVNSPGFDVSKVFPQIGLRKVILHTEINGSGFTKKDLNVKVSGNIDYLEYKNYAFSNSKIEGNYSKKIFFGHVSIDDPMLYLDFNGTVDYSKKIPNYQFVADVEHAHLVDLQIINRHPSSLLTTHLNATVSGDKLDNFVGQVVFFNTQYFENNWEYVIKDIDVSSRFDDLGYRSIMVKSDWVDAYVNGKFEFSDLGSSFGYILRRYLPSYAPEKIGISKLWSESKNPKKTITSKNTERRYLSFDINVKESDPITTLFAPKFKAKGVTTINGFLNTITQHIEFQAKTDSLLIGALGLKQIEVNGTSKDSVLKIMVDCGEFLWSKKDTFLFSNIHFSSLLKNDSMQFNVGWISNKNWTEQSLMNGALVFSKSPIIKGSLTSANIWANDSLWHVDENNSFFVDSAQFAVNTLRFFSNDKQIVIDGKGSHNPDDVLKVKLINFNLSEADTWANHRNFDLDGVTTGVVEMSQIFDKFSIIVNLKVLDLGLNRQKLGNANVVSAWDERKNGLFVNIDVLYRGNIGEAKPVTIQGYFYPKGGILDMQAELVNFKLKVIEPYLKTLFYRVDGLASGKAKIIGTINKPQISGKLKLMRTELGVNYLNTKYTINQVVELQYNKILFDSVAAMDDYFHTAVLNGWVTHEDFKNFKLDVTLKAVDFMALNTTRAMNEMFYGKAFGTGAVRIFGAAPNLQIDAQMETNENTEISVPISFNTVVDKTSFINFVSTAQKTVATPTNTFIDLGLNMNFLFKVTPDAKFHIYLDPSTGGSLHGTGSGNIRMNVNTKGDFNMYGTYVVSKGEYEMKLKDILTRKFDIEQGGTIQWNGDPTDAEIDIRAVFPTTASLASVLNLDSTSATPNRKIKVNSVVKLTGKLLNPEVRFGIELPNADNTTRALVYNMIDTTNDQNMIRQTFSLLVLGQLEPTANQYGSIVGAGVGMSSMELISNQLGNFLSQVSKDVNVGLSYKTAADKYTTDELQIALSTALFNDRVIIEGNMSAGGQNKDYQSQNPNNVVGDVIVEVKLTNDGRWRTKVYNIANTNELTYQNAYYIQGVGFIYRVDFNKFSELFRKKKP